MTDRSPPRDLPYEPDAKRLDPGLLATCVQPAYPPRVPIYIVRWANRSASIVRARNEEHLEQLLDEVGDPGAALWEEYDGPLWARCRPRIRGW